MKQKGLTPLVIIILIAFTFGGYLLFRKQFKPAAAPQKISQPSQTLAVSDATANWKKYTNTSFGFSFKYPKDWKLEGDGIANELSVFGDPYNKNDYQLVFVKVVDNSKNLSIEDYVQKFRSSMKTDYKEITVGNEKGKQAILSGQCGGDNNIFVKKNGRIYEIQWPKCRGKDVNSKIFDTILSTFKFLP